MWLPQNLLKCMLALMGVACLASFVWLRALQLLALTYLCLAHRTRLVVAVLRCCYRSATCVLTSKTVNVAAGGRWGRQEGHYHLRTVPSAEVLPQDPDAFGARAGEEVQVRKTKLTGQRKLVQQNTSSSWTFCGRPCGVVGWFPAHGCCAGRSIFFWLMLLHHQE